MYNTEKINEMAELRAYISKCLIERLHSINNSLNQIEQYKIKLKTWCITLFMVSIGFCLKEGFNTNDSFKEYLFWFLPFAPVIVFWFHHAYKENIIKLSYVSEEVQKITKTLSELYDEKYTLEKLRKKGKQVINYKHKKLKITWANRNKVNIRRGLKKLFWETPKTAIFNFESVFFFGFLGLIWYLIVIINFRNNTSIFYSLVIAIFIFISICFILYLKENRKCKSNK